MSNKQTSHKQTNVTHTNKQTSNKQANKPSSKLEQLFINHNIL